MLNGDDDDDDDDEDDETHYTFEYNSLYHLTNRATFGTGRQHR